MTILDLEPRPGPPRARARKLRESVVFYKGWFSNPRRVGAIAPTGSVMAREMASVVRPDSTLPVLELGPGTGAITEAILERGVAPERLVSVERSEVFLAPLRRRFPGVRFVHGDAFDIARVVAAQRLELFDAVVSALPLLMAPVHRRVRFVEAVLDLLEPGRPLIQFSYKLGPPVPARPGRYEVSHTATVLRNLPPARLWIYRRLPAL